jgi:hypothetical protein
VIEKKHRALASVYLVNDVLASNLAMLCAWALRFQFEVIPVTKGQQDLATYGMTSNWKRSAQAQSIARFDARTSLTR